MRKAFIIFCLSIGGFYLYSSGYMLIKAEISQFFIKNAWLKTLKDKRNHKPWSWADTYPIFEFNVPRIKKSSYVLQGQSGRNMAFSAVHLNSSGMPGESKSTVISGHNDSHFNYLKEVQNGDIIYIQDKNQSHTYIVTSINIVNSKQEKLNIRNVNELILTTCYPFDNLQFGSDLRYVIYADSISRRI